MQTVASLGTSIALVRGGYISSKSSKNFRRYATLMITNTGSLTCWTSLMEEPEPATQSQDTHMYPRECPHWYADRDHAWHTVHSTQPEALQRAPTQLEAHTAFVQTPATSNQSGVTPATSPASNTLKASRKAEETLVLPTSGQPPINGHVVQTIMAGKYVDLVDLLPEALREMQFDDIKEAKSNE